MTTRATIAALYRYPVKGLTPERLDAVDVAAGATIPFDRAYAIEAGTRKFDAASPRHLPKVNFVMLMRDERLALLTTRFDPATRTLTIARDGATVAEAKLDDPTGRKVIEQFFAGFLAKETRGAPKVVAAPGHSFSDVAARCVSIINLASVRDIARVAGRPVDPLRFRGNLYVDGLDPWQEFGWVGGALVAGEVVLDCFDRIRRCAATNVDPATAERDMDIPRLLTGAFGHGDCGVYATVARGGRLGEGLAIGPT